MRRPSRSWTSLMLAAGLAGVVQCRPPEPAPTTPPTTAPTEPPPKLNRWGTVVLYEKGGSCRHLAGPPRIEAHVGETITWRIYNRCSRASTVRIADLRLSPQGYKPASEARDEEEAKKAYEERKQHPPRNPFEEGETQREVPPDRWRDLRLKIKDDAEVGLYTYKAWLDGKPDPDQEIGIRPPRG